MFHFEWNARVRLHQPSNTVRRSIIGPCFAFLLPYFNESPPCNLKILNCGRQNHDSREERPKCPQKKGSLQDLRCTCHYFNIIFFRFICCLYVVFAKIELLQFAFTNCVDGRFWQLNCSARLNKFHRKLVVTDWAREFVSVNELTCNRVEQTAQRGKKGQNTWCPASLNN